MQPPYQGERRRLVPDTPGESVPITHRVADDMRRAMSAHDNGGGHVQAQSSRRRTNSRGVDSLS